MPLPERVLCLVTALDPGEDPAPLLASVRAAVRGGVNMVQVRAPELERTAFFNLADNVLGVHITQADVGTYQAAHHHYGGAHIIVLSETRGYTLIWPKDVGIRPFSEGYGDTVVKIDWGKGHMFVPPEGWFHQHFITGGSSLMKLAILWGYKHPLGINLCKWGDTSNLRKRLQEGGTLIGREDEDEEIKRMFAEEMKKRAV